MPLSAELENLLKLIPDDTEREARRKELTELNENGLRQADYSRKMNELSDKKKLDEESHTKNVAWFNRAKIQYDTMESDLKAANEKIAGLESVKEFGGQHPEFDIDEKELNKQLTAARQEAAEAQKKITELGGVVSGFDKMIKEGKLMTSEKFDEELNKRGDALGAALLDIIDLQTKHVKEFGTEIDRASLITEAQKPGANLVTAYEKLTKDLREKKLRSDIEAEVEKKYQEKLKANNVPYAPGSDIVLGPLQQRLQKKDTGIPDDVQADGSGRLGSLIGAELRSEGKF